MIVSHANKYLFLETPGTASLAIRSELRRNYGGEAILYRHANFTALPAKTRRRVADYVVFAGVRNPLDSVASAYQKFLLNNNDMYSDPSQRIENGGWVDFRLRRLYRTVHTPGATFLTFLNQAYPHQYCSRVSINKKYCNEIIRFEHLQDDFAAVLSRIGMPQTRPLPIVNATAGKRRYSDYYDDSEETTRQIAKVFGPFMIEWGYLSPDDAMFHFVTPADHLRYGCLKLLMKGYQDALHVTRSIMSFRKPKPVPGRS